MRFDRVSERLIRSDSVVVLTADSFAVDDSTGLEVDDDSLHGPFGDSDLARDFAKYKPRLSRQQRQHVRVIREKRPLGPGRLRRS